MSALFAFKLTLVPFFILALSLAGRRWGTSVSGWLVSLPVVAGPIVFFIGVEQGEAFAAGAARATIAGLASLAVYSLVYCRVALRAGWAPSVLAGWAGFFLSTYLLNRLPLTLPQSIALALFSLVAAYTPVYLRGIIMSLARELKLDGQKVARSYLEHMAAALHEPK